jgi:hypothetical protein
MPLILEENDWSVGCIDRFPGRCPGLGERLGLWPKNQSPANGRLRHLLIRRSLARNPDPKLRSMINYQRGWRIFKEYFEFRSEVEETQRFALKNAVQIVAWFIG